MIRGTNGPSRSKGQLIAIALRGAWRVVPPPLELGENELKLITPALLRSGSAALVWWKASRNSDLREALREFLITYKVQTLRATIHELNVKKVFTALGATRVEAMLVKGWAIARRYPKPALRPYGDLDVCVRPDQFEVAKQTLKQSEAHNVWVDLHRGFGTLDNENADILFNRATTAPARGFMVQVPSEEDHLRILCLHLFRHGAWRPVWLCDIALALETRKKEFNWERFYGHDPRQRERLTCVISLAQELLGAHFDPATEVEKCGPVPRWLVRAVERRWTRWFNADYRDRALTSLLSHRFEPAIALEDFYFRFDPLRATVEVNGSFNKTPRLPYQLAALAKRLPEVPARIADVLQARSRHR